MPDRRSLLDTLGTVAFLLIVTGVAAAVTLSFAMNAAADELRQQVRVATSLDREIAATPWGVWLAARMSSDLPPDAFDARFARAEDLDHRADRIRELAGAASVAGLVLILATASPTARRLRSQSRTSPLAKPTSNGTI